MEEALHVVGKSYFVISLDLIIEGALPTHLFIYFIFCSECHANILNTWSDWECSCNAFKHLTRNLKHETDDSWNFLWFYWLAVGALGWWWNKKHKYHTKITVWYQERTFCKWSSRCPISRGANFYCNFWNNQIHSNFFLNFACYNF